MIEPGEPYWLPEDTEAAMEWMDYKASLCDGCGHPREESFDKANFEKYVATAMQCHACAARDRHSSAMSSGEGDSSGMYYAVERPGAE